VNLEDLPLALTVDQFAETFDFDRKVVYRAVEAGDIRSCRVGRAIRIPRSAVAEWLGETDPTEEPDYGTLRVVES
jgi:excisionase family DNA binding protein